MFTENQFIDAVDEALEQYICGQLSFEEAHERLLRLGHDAYEAQAMLTECVR